MAAKYRMPATPEQSSAVRWPARRGSGVAAVCEVASASMLCAAACAALLLNAPHGQKRTIEASQEPPVASQSVRQEGTVIAVSPGSVTARSANGYTQTYLVTPNTALIGHGGGQPAGVASHFTVNDHVEIVGTIQGGTALATAVADRDAGRGDGPPMDYLDGQVIPAGRT
ncbi:hypothetical protein [Mycobacterium sp. ACS4054]|uniref:hypothetical protein n=1 Tax=Mycobacterium sp. ACS4054 TaxID=1834119 RepID=UPI0009EF4F3B|nr:hypothetical protein [Mycobacterium sp. ACS4054]